MSLSEWNRYWPILVFNRHGSTHHQIKLQCVLDVNLIGHTVLFPERVFITWCLCVRMHMCKKKKKKLVNCWVSWFPPKNMNPFFSQGLPGQPGSPGPAGKEGPVVSILLFILFPHCLWNIDINWDFKKQRSRHWTLNTTLCKTSKILLTYYSEDR